MAQRSGGRDFAVAIDIGGTKLLTILADGRDEIVAECRISTEAQFGPRAVVGRLVDTVRGLLRDQNVPISGVVGVGIASAGPCNPARGMVLNSPNLAGWHNIPLTQWMQEELGVPACLGNDANLAALAENVYGVGQGTDNMVYVTVSTGIGGGIIANGELYTGGLGTAGEIGHTILQMDGPTCSCGGRGCLETFAAGWALAKKARASIAEGKDSILLQLVDGDPEKISAETLFWAADRGDALSRAILDDGAHHLGVGLSSLAIMLDPEVIVVGGGLSTRWNDYVGKAVEYVHATKHPIPLNHISIVPAKLVGRVSVMGALALARQKFAGKV
jgi:glucokinase